MSATGRGSGPSPPETARKPTRYESQKRRDWQTFVRYLAAHRPPLVLRRCSGAHVLEFLRYLDRFGKTRVHAPPCLAYGARASTATAPCQCPLRQAWGSLDALVGRLRAAFEERHGRSGSGDVPQQDATGCNPFAARAVRLYLRDVREAQSKARGISYHKKKKKKRKLVAAGSCVAEASSSKNAGGGTEAESNGEREHKTNNVAPMPQPQVPPPLLPLPPCLLAGVPLDCCDTGSIVRVGGGATGAGCYGGIYLPLFFSTRFLSSSVPD